MPDPVQENYLNCCLYIYGSEETARAGRRDRTDGGSGFIICVRLGIGDWVEFYAVTAAHVLKGLKKTVLRINLKSGGYDCLEVNDWTTHSYCRYRRGPD